MKNPVRAMTTGFGTIFSGLRLVRTNAKIMRLAIIPFCIDFMILAGVFVWGSSRLSGWVDQGLSMFLPDVSGFWWSIIYWPLFIFAWVAFVGLLFFFGYVIANLVAAPFNSLLAEKTLEELEMLKKSPFNFKRWMSISRRMLWASLLKTGLFLIFGVVLFVVSFVPALGVIASFGLLLVMAFDSSDYSFELLEYNLSQRLAFFRKNIFYFIGSAGALGLTLLIPGLNFLLFPAAVVGSADLIRKIQAQSE